MLRGLMWGRPSMGSPCPQIGMRSRCSGLGRRSYWIPGSSTPTASEKRSPFLKPLQNKVFQESRVTTIALDDIGTSTTLESNKSVAAKAMPTNQDGETVEQQRGHRAVVAELREAIGE